MQGSGLVADRLDQVCDLTEFCVHPGRSHHAHAAAKSGHGAHEDHITAIADAQVFPVEQFDYFFDRLRLAGQNGFLHSQVEGLNQAAIRRDSVASVQLDDVARDQDAGFSGQQPPAAAYFDLGHSHFFQGRHGLFGLIFLGKTQNSVQDNNDQNDDGVQVLAQEKRNTGSDDQDQNHDLGHLFP